MVGSSGGVRLFACEDKDGGSRAGSNGGSKIHDGDINVFEGKKTRRDTDELEVVKFSTGLVQMVVGSAVVQISPVVRNWGC